MTVCGGNDASFAAKTDGDPAAGRILYQWQRRAGASDGWTNLVDGSLNETGTSIVGAQTPVLTIQRATGAAAGQVRCVVSNDCTTDATAPAALVVNSADFNNDGDLGTDTDIEAFFACVAGSCCPTCGSADFDADGSVGTDADIESFFRVLGGGPC
jgi:hypothetical protein